MPIIVSEKDTFEMWRVKTNAISDFAESNIGNTQQLVTIARSNLVASINETQRSSNITGGKINNVTIGLDTPNVGAFTILSVTNGNFANANVTNANVTNANVVNLTVANSTVSGVDRVVNLTTGAVFNRFVTLTDTQLTSNANSLVIMTTSNASVRIGSNSNPDHLVVTGNGVIVTGNSSPALGYNNPGDVNLPAARRVRSVNTAKGWVVWNGTTNVSGNCTILDSDIEGYVVSKRGTGKYRITFPYAFSNTAYPCFPSVGKRPTSSSMHIFIDDDAFLPTNSQIQVATVESTTAIALDSERVSLLVFGSEKQSLVFSAPGSYSYTVPSGVTRITASIFGAGGGGGGGGWSNCAGQSGDAYGGGGGGSGGYITQVFNVTPGETLTINVGLRGAGAGYNAGSGGTGGTSNIFGLAGNVTATGGIGGQAGINCGSMGGGAGGSPNGVSGNAGGSGGGGAGGNHSQLYGIGGNGGGIGVTSGLNGANGAVLITIL